MSESVKVRRGRRRMGLRKKLLYGIFSPDLTQGLPAKEIQVRSVRLGGPASQSATNVLLLFWERSGLIHYEGGMWFITQPLSTEGLSDVSK